MLYGLLIVNLSLVLKFKSHQVQVFVDNAFNVGEKYGLSLSSINTSVSIEPQCPNTICLSVSLLSMYHVNLTLFLNNSMDVNETKKVG